MKELKTRIEDAKKILIVGHINPDGDTIGAGLALLLGLEKTYPDKKIDFVLQDDVPGNIRFLKATRKIKNVHEIVNKDYDITIFVDSANIERVGDAKTLVGDSFKINIDHHISNLKYGDLNIVEDISSTSELMYSILKELDIEMTLEMAEAIYLGLINDTGNFAHSNVTSNTFKVASELIELGVNSNQIVNNFFKSKSPQKMRALGLALSEMVYIEDKKLVYFYLPYSYMDEIEIGKEDTEGLVEELLNYDKSEVSLFLREFENGKIKGSLRSKNDVDVNRIAQLFNGGGHIKAAGFATNLSANKIIKKVVENL